MGNQPHGVATASVGMGNFDVIVPPEDAFRVVDDALYRAKALACNQAAKAIT